MEIIRDTQRLMELAPAWNTLLAHSATNVPFLRHEYLSTWWRTLGGGEWSDGELWVVLEHDDQGRLRGIAPLFRTEVNAQPTLLLLGSVEISDYLDFIVAEENKTSFLQRLLDWLDSPQAPLWTALDLYNIPEDSTTPAILHTLAAERGWRLTQEVLQPAPFVTLPTDWEHYLAGLKKKHRHEIRRKLRRAAAHEPPVRWYFVQEEEQLDAALEAFFQLMAYDEKKAAFLTEVMRSQMRAAVHAAFRAGWLQLAFLTVGEEKAAAFLNFDYANRIWVYNSGLNPAFAHLSPGWVLLSHLIQWSIAQGREVLDFMRGDETYKYRFGGQDRHVLRIRLTR